MLFSKLFELESERGNMGKGKTILITGAGGFTGRHACDFFHKQGYQVYALMRNQPILSLPYNIIICDLLSLEQIEEAVNVSKPDYILHLAGRCSVTDSWEHPVDVLSVNTMATAKLIDEARKHVKHCRILIPGSALEFEPNQIETLKNPYSLSKTIQVILAKSWIQLFESQVILAKPTNLIGPGNSTGICAILGQRIAEIEAMHSHDKEEAIEIAVNATRDFLDVRDAIKAYELLLRKGKVGEVYEICSETSYTLLEVMAIYKSLTNENIHFEEVEELRPSYVASMSAQRLRELGWVRDYTLKESLNDVLTHFRNKIKKDV
ncbi:hypothetical protein CKF48_22470 [Cytobacillus kochii]|uniref:NAD-dependent epimerase/dehydratase domain-containing protein n=2 Tax=Bacillaceae TaxID=186817 RepID=A0A248TP09_9BACI|nr:hypothetical protein CKF48_22470 [Cytobacillus kochii]